MIATRPYMMTGNAQLLPIDRNDPSLVFYLSMWYPHGDMTGSTIYSYDIYRHSCTVTGAIYGSQGRTFDGTDDVIACGNNAVLNPTGSITLEVWVYSLWDESTMTDTSGRNILGKDSLTYQLMYAGSVTDKVYFYINDSGGYWNAPTNGWHHIVGTYNGIKRILYVDGSLLATADKTGAISTSARHLGLGGRLDTTGVGDGRYFDGTVGEARIYSRALIFSEIQHNYQATKWRYT